MEKKPKEVIYEHTDVKKMLHYVNVWFLPFRWGANTYRGCEHSCVYCNARYTHEYLGLPTGEFSHKLSSKIMRQKSSIRSCPEKNGTKS